MATVTPLGDISIAVGEGPDRTLGTELDPVQLSIFSHRFMSIAGGAQGALGVPWEILGGVWGGPGGFWGVLRGSGGSYGISWGCSEGSQDHLGVS